TGSLPQFEDVDMAPEARSHLADPRQTDDGVSDPVRVIIDDVDETVLKASHVERIHHVSHTDVPTRGWSRFRPGNGHAVTIAQAALVVVRRSAQTALRPRWVRRRGVMTPSPGSPESA